jgi:hypothetical protein
VLPTIAILLGFFLIVAGNQFLGRNDSYGMGIAIVAGGGALILSGLWMIVARERRRMLGRKRQGFEVVPAKQGESSAQESD